MGGLTNIRPTADGERIAAMTRFGSMMALPFIGIDDDGALRTHWAPRVTHSYVTDNEIGRSYGEALVRHMRREGDMQVFRQVMLDLVKHADCAKHRGVMVGMFGYFGDALLG